MWVRSTMGSETDFILFIFLEQGLISTLAGIRHVLSTHDFYSHTKCSLLPLPVLLCAYVSVFSSPSPDNLTPGFPTSKCSAWAVVAGLRCAGSCVNAEEEMYSIGFQMRNNIIVARSINWGDVWHHRGGVRRYCCVQRLDWSTSGMSC